MLEDERIALAFLDSLDKARKNHKFEVWAYVLMPEHVHLLIWPRDEIYDMSLIRKSFKRTSSGKAIGIMREHKPRLAARLVVTWPGGRSENRFWQQGAGYDRNVFTPDVIRSSIEYIHANPARRGLVESLDEWMYSSFRCYHGSEDVPFKTDLWPGR